ncbi:2Fe-2S iron-sulfur cluster-binding protein [Halalkalicoccus jeotgali]|uniref:Ferredoxin n=1 Tax=Halalkalicoccus jeotgali (strain DSM 18796 / CECT 7217 / JCM 14584 / KCTC 4019 / B3) TaxID=795797 RepID=D8J3K7_HALJB|nr:2Fe-2S iron-sulfur cluster-binding protein [Halalkalicoccus jeotgali]ADJ15314.1 ferredoxin [Halalkalicoccus jeotgali B3]ELY35473.1 ferredoxin [Halalkalicoccus jeotgali B3]
MPTISYEGERIECAVGTELREALLEAGLSPHNGASNYANCGGWAVCGTCAVAVDGAVSEMSEAERKRLSKWPHDLDSGLRLACQTHIEGDVEVRKYGGFWGQNVDQ